MSRRLVASVRGSSQRADQSAGRFTRHPRPSNGQKLTNFGDESVQPRVISEGSRSRLGEPVNQSRSVRAGPIDRGRRACWTGCGAALMPALGLRNYRPGPARRVMQEDDWCEAGQRAGFRVSLRATPRRVSESAVCDDLVRAGPDEPYVDRLRRAAYPSQARRTRDGGGGGGVRRWRSLRVAARRGCLWGRKAASRRRRWTR